MRGGLLPDALDGVPRVACWELQVPSTSRSRSSSNPSNSRFPPPSTERCGGDRELIDHARREALTDQVGTTTEGDPAVAGELACLPQRRVEAVNVQEARTRIG